MSLDFGSIDLEKAFDLMQIRGTLKALENNKMNKMSI